MYQVSQKLNLALLYSEDEDAGRLLKFAFSVLGHVIFLKNKLLYVCFILFKIWYATVSEENIKFPLI
jgi:hypothetical protein